MLRRFFLLILIQFLIAAQGAGLQAAQAKTSRHDRNPVAEKTDLPVYVWHDTRVRPKAMVLAIHGLTMHGTSFDTIANHLAAQKFLVAAPDLRGHGSWYQKNARCKAKYETSEKDIAAVARTLRTTYPGIPLFVAGESLGGTAALRLAAHRPELVDGLILSAPALRYRGHVGVKTVAQVAMLITNPKRRIDMGNYLNYFSNDERIMQEELADPLMRKRMGLGELIASCLFMSNSAQFVDDIPVDMPILIMQGKEDRMVKPVSVAFLERKLKSSKRTVQWFPRRGHILLETAHVDKETLDIVSSWLQNNCVMRTTRATAYAATPD